MREPAKAVRRVAGRDRASTRRICAAQITDRQCPERRRDRELWAALALDRVGIRPLGLYVLCSRLRSATAAQRRTRAVRRADVGPVGMGAKCQILATGRRPNGSRRGCAAPPSPVRDRTYPSPLARATPVRSAADRPSGNARRNRGDPRPARGRNRQNRPASDRRSATGRRNAERRRSAPAASLRLRRWRTPAPSGSRPSSAASSTGASRRGRGRSTARPIRA